MPENVPELNSQFAEKNDSEREKVIKCKGSVKHESEIVQTQASDTLPVPINRLCKISMGDFDAMREYKKTSVFCLLSH